MSDIRVSVTGPAPIAVRVTGATGVSPTITNGQTFRVNLAGVGPTGPSGPAGAVGPTGARGLDGTAASAGATGPSGPAGERGPTGSVGPQGIQGEVGHTGPAGAAGSVGATGARGADGAVGPSGSVGPQGERGSTGERGATGERGTQGEVGPSGPAGAAGATGPSGPRGADGAPGSVGPTGARGADGLSITGPSGPAGAVGPTGARGADGASITGPTGPAGGGGGGGSQEIFSFTTTAGFPATGATGVYIATDSGRQYRFDSSGVYVEIGPDNGSTLWSLWLPPAPTALTATAGSASASLAWTAPSVSPQTPIQDYRVQYSSDGGTTWTTFSDGVTTSTIANVTGLTNGVSYVFRVAAVNAIGVGAFTAASSSATPIPVSAGLALWLDASDASSLFDATSGGAIVAADGAVARWQDKSGSARHATQATSGSRPLRKTSQQGGKDALLFDGIDDFLRVQYNASGSSGFTIFAVFRRVAASTAYAFSNYEYSPGNGRGLLFGGSTSNAVNASGRPDGTSAFRSASFGNATTSYIVAVARWNGSNLVVYSNGAGQSSTAASSAALQSSDSIVIGAAYAADPALIQSFSSIGIGEIIVYDSALSDADRALVENYLIAKWGVS